MGDGILVDFQSSMILFRSWPASPPFRSGLDADNLRQPTVKFLARFGVRFPELLVRMEWQIRFLDETQEAGAPSFPSDDVRHRPNIQKNPIKT